MRLVCQLVKTCHFHMSSLEPVHHRWLHCLLSSSYGVSTADLQVQGWMPINAFNTHMHTRTHTPLHHLNSLHQHSPSGAGLDCQHRRQQVGRPLILCISGAHLKGPEAKTGGLKTTGFFIQLCLRLAGLSPVHVPPTAETSGCCLLREEWGRMTEHSFIALKWLCCVHAKNT